MPMQQDFIDVLGFQQDLNDLMAQGFSRSQATALLQGDPDIVYRAEQSSGGVGGVLGRVQERKQQMDQLRKQYQAAGYEKEEIDKLMAQANQAPLYTNYLGGRAGEQYTEGERRRRMRGHEAEGDLLRQAMGGRYKWDPEYGIDMYYRVQGDYRGTGPLQGVHWDTPPEGHLMFQHPYQPDKWDQETLDRIDRERIQAVTGNFTQRDPWARARERFMRMGGY